MALLNSDSCFVSRGIVFYRYWQNNHHEGQKFTLFDNLSPIVSAHDNFDSLLIPSDHVSRSRSDTYYYDDTTVLRTHTSAHQSNIMSMGYEAFLVTGDVYR